MNKLSTYPSLRKRLVRFFLLLLVGGLLVTAALTFTLPGVLQARWQRSGGAARAARGVRQTVDHASSAAAGTGRQRHRRLRRPAALLLLQPPGKKPRRRFRRFAGHLPLGRAAEAPRRESGSLRQHLARALGHHSPAVGNARRRDVRPDRHDHRRQRHYPRLRPLAAARRGDVWRNARTGPTVDRQL